MPVPAADFARRLSDLSAALAKKIMRLSAPLNGEKLSAAIQSVLYDALQLGLTATEAALRDATAARAAWLKEEFQGLYVTASHDALVSLATFKQDFEQAWPDIAAAALDTPVAPKPRAAKAPPANGEPEPDPTPAPDPAPAPAPVIGGTATPTPPRPF